MTDQNASVHGSILKLKSLIGQSIIGQEDVVERIILGLLAGGNILLEGLPGLAKTRAVKALADNLNAGLSRIQFTPDLLPSDITGTEVFYSSGDKETFTFQPGPIFNNLILADEINRAPAKVQAALLEAMEERQVTVAGKTRKMPELFMVLATQNPIEQEGTYPLPEAQTDRFLMHVNISYPTDDQELDVVRLVRGEEMSGIDNQSHGPIEQDAVFSARNEIQKIHIAENMEKYIVSIISATRYPEKYDKDLDRWIDVGASPRGSIALDKVSRAHAWLTGSEMVTPDNVRAVVHDCLRHRIILSFEANAEGVGSDAVIDKIMTLVATV